MVKDEQSNLTSFGSKIKGSLNDSNLRIIGFDNYSIVYETFALTRLIFFIMTGKYSLDKVKDEKVIKFVCKGVNADINERYQSVDELQKAFHEAFFTP